MSEENNTDAQELERLRTKNAELLTELKKAKGERDALSITVESHAAEIADFKVNKPVEGLLDKLLVASKYSSQEFAEHFKFELNADGVLQMLDADGQPVTVKDKVDGVEVDRPIKCDEVEVRQYLVKYDKLNHIMRAWANGGGAGHGYAEPSKGDKRTEAPAPEFGLGRQ
jgi:hypothetical protein